MAQVASRHHVSHNGYQSRHKPLPITMPTKAPTYSLPTSRVVMSPDLSDSSTTYSSHGSRHSAGSYSVGSYAPSASSSDDYSYERHEGVDVVDELSHRLNSAFDGITMDRALVQQAQTSGALNAKQRELAELQAMAQRRLKTARVNLAEGMQAARETRRDLDYISKKTSSVKSKAERKHPDAYARASRRHRGDDY